MYTVLQNLYEWTKRWPTGFYCATSLQLFRLFQGGDGDLCGKLASNAEIFIENINVRVYRDSRLEIRAKLLDKVKKKDRDYL